MLLLAIASFTDTGNNPATPGLTPLLLGLIMVGIATAYVILHSEAALRSNLTSECRFGYQTGFVLNPARDLGPRLLIWAVTNIDSNTLWLTYDAYGIWVPTVGTISESCVSPRPNAFRTDHVHSQPEASRACSSTISSSTPVETRP